MIVEIWDSVPMSTINRIASSFSNRVRMCLEKGGESIQCFARSNLDCIPEFFRCKEVNYLTLWTNDDDELLKFYVNKIVYHLKKISYYFPNRTSNEIKQRYWKLYLILKTKKIDS